MSEPTEGQLAVKLETEVMLKEDSRNGESASPSDLTRFAARQAELKGELQRLKAKGIDIPGGDAALLLRADGASVGDLAALSAQVEGLLRDAGGKEIQVAVGDVIKDVVAVSGGQDVSESRFFSSLGNGLSAMLKGESQANDKGADVPARGK